MNDFLDETSNQQTKEELIELSKIILFLLLGVIMGVFSKYMDSVPKEQLPDILRIIELDRFLSRLPVWLSLGLGISLAFKKPLKASIAVFLFFFSLVSSYYWFSDVFLGIYPAHHVAYWFQLTAISPVLAYFCWYIQKKEWYGTLLFFGVCLVFVYSTVIEPIFIKKIFSLLDILLLIVTISFLRRKRKPSRD